MPPVGVHEKACTASSPMAISLQPTIRPVALTAVALLLTPPSVPRLTIPPVGVHEKACTASSPRVAISLQPTTG